MKPLHLLALLGSLIIPSVTSAYTPPTGGDGPVIILHPKTPIGNRPKVPSTQQVTCTYFDGNLYFEFAFPEGNCRIILSDLSTGETVAATFDSAVSEPVYVGYHSTGTLTVDTANGNIYSGVW